MSVFALEHGAMLRAFSCESLFKLTSSLRIIMMSIQEYTLQELIGSQQGKWLCRPEVCFTILRPASWCTCMKQCVHI